jgi:hypothetical protein
MLFIKAFAVDATMVDFEHPRRTDKFHLNLPKSWDYKLFGIKKFTAITNASMAQEYSEAH